MRVATLTVPDSGIGACDVRFMQEAVLTDSPSTLKTTHPESSDPGTLQTAPSPLTVLSAPKAKVSHC